MKSRDLCLVYCAILCIVSSAAALRCYQRFSSKRYPYCQQFSSSFVVHWSLNDTDVNFAVDVDQPNAAYVSLGVSEMGGMVGSDLWVLSFGIMGPPEWTLTDMNSWEYSPPATDDQDNVVLKAVYADGNGTAFEMQRKLHTCDTYNDIRLYPNETMAFVWAHSNESWTYHGPVNRGTFRMRLLLEETATPTILQAAGVSEDNSTQLKSSQLSLTVPTATANESASSYHWCSHFDVPSDARYHITSVSYKSSSPAVSRIMLWACDLSAKAFGSPYSCPQSLKQGCSVLYSSWLPGQDDDVMPKVAGLPVGRGSFPSVAIQVQYRDVPEGTRLPSPVVTLSLTQTLRQYDLGVLQLGQRYLNLPDYNESFKADPSICPSSCSSRLSGDAVMVSQAGHMGAFGKMIGTRHVKGEAEVQAVGNRYGWDPNFQGYSFVTPGSETLSPGDTLITTCTYNTIPDGSSYSTSPADETCRHFVRYYPANPIDVCWSIPPALYTTKDSPAAAVCTSHANFSSLLASDKYKSLKDVLAAADEFGYLVGFDPEESESSFEELKLWEGCAMPGPAPPARIYQPPPGDSSSVPPATPPIVVVSNPPNPPPPMAPAPRITPAPTGIDIVPEAAINNKTTGTASGVNDTQGSAVAASGDTMATPTAQASTAGSIVQHTAVRVLLACLVLLIA